MIKYDYEITVNGNQAKLNKDIYLFRGNKNVHYYFAVKNDSFNFKGSTDLIEKTNAINAAVTVIKPNNVEVASAIAKVENGKIHLKVTEDLIDEEVEVGDFDLVFDLFDDTDGAVTIPKVIGQFHVLERPCTTPISELVATNTTNEVDQALTDYAIVTYAEPVASTNADGTFAKKTWVAKEKITTAELNRMEEGISDVSSQCKDIAKQIENVGSPTDEQVTTAINQAIKDGKISTLDSTTKKALMDIVENIGLWADGNGQKYIDNLKNALYTSPLSSISAIYTQNKTIYVDDDLDVLKEDLVVTGIYTDGSSINITDYTLSGTLSVGTSTITVLKDGKTTTFEVIVTATRIPATNINLDKTKISFLNNTPIQITATVEPSNSTDNITWSSSEENVAKVKNGLVTPVSDGSCIIYAKAGDVTVECSINVSFPLSGFNMGNPYLTKVDTSPESGKTEKELQNKWYKASYNPWANALGITDSRWVYMHPFGEGTYYIRVLSDSRSTPYRMYAFGNSDIGTNPTTTLGIVGTSYKDAYFTELTTFDWVDYEGNQKSGNVNLGEYKYVDGSEQSFGECWARVIKLTVPANTYVFLTANMYTAKITPGISNNYSLNDLYTIFESDPSANILQIVK